MSSTLAELWNHFASTSVLGIFLTLTAYLACVWLFERGGRHPLLHPVLLTIGLLVALLTATGTPYHTYFQSAQLIHFLLGPATVALAVPLYAQIGRIRRLLFPMAASLLIGCCVAALSAVGIAKVLGVQEGPVLYSLAPKSATSPVAMGIAELIGGNPSLAAVFVVLTGILGAMLAPGLLRLMGVRDDAARGFAIGLAAHGLGTARAFQLGEAVGAFSGLAMGLNALATALLVPLLLRILGL